jgi:hypothetical protein
MLATIREFVAKDQVRQYRKGRLSGVSTVVAEDMFYCKFLVKSPVNGSLPPLRTLQQFAIESRLPKLSAGAALSAPFGVHGHYHLDELAGVCPEVELIRKGDRLKTYKQDFSTSTAA